MRKNESYLKFAFLAGLAWLNIFIFFKLTSLAANFARIYANVYGQTLAKGLAIIFAGTFFLVFRNLTLLALAVESKNGLEKTFKNISLFTVVILFLLLILQTFPEYLLTINYLKGI